MPNAKRGRGTRGRGRGRGVRGGRGGEHGVEQTPVKESRELPQPVRRQVRGTRGRGRGRGRGGEHGVEQTPIEEALRQAKAHTTRLSVAAPQKLDRKRVVELDRDSLPDVPAPPRKRRTLRPSPERSACVLDPFADLQPGISRDLEVKNEDDQLPEAGPSDVFVMNLEVQEDGSTIQVATDTSNVEDQDEMLLLDGPTPSLAIGNEDLGIGRWLNDSDDDDLNFEVDETESISALPTTATSQPADDTGLTTAEIKVLRAEDEASDRFVRERAPTDHFHFDWNSSRETFKGTREAFTGTSGPTFPVTDSMKPVDIFYKMFDTAFIDMIVMETNRYADQTLTRVRNDPTAAKFSRVLRWKPTDRDEMLTYLSVVLLQGLYPKVKEESYFAYDGFGTTPYFSCIMSYNRYRLLKMFLHFTDNETSTDRTKLNKIRPVIDYLNGKFSGLYMPRQEIAIDESLLKWLGRLSFSQKINSKAARVGVKTYELCESCSGYLWQFRVYTGKDGPNRPNQSDRHDEHTDRRHDDRLDADRPGDAERATTTTRPTNATGPTNATRPTNATGPTNATASIVYDLIDPLLHRGHTLIMDNFYNSPLLARCLKRDGQTDVFGTLRLNREFVPDALKTITKANMKPGEIVVTYCSDLAVMLWRDSNLVSMISTYHPLQIGAQERHDGDGTTYKPAIVLDYNKFMGGVDRKDQFLASQPLERQKNKMWYKKLFRRLYNAAVFNCFVIYTSNNRNNKISHRQFRTTLAEDLIKIHRRVDLLTEPRLLPQKASVSKTPTVNSTSTAVTPHLAVISAVSRPFIAENHFPMPTGTKYTRCWMCRQDNKTSRTSYKCEACNVNLCLVGCFKAYHKP